MKIERATDEDEYYNYLDCYECGKSHLRKVIQLGAEQDYDSYTTYLCLDCLRKAIKLFEKES